MRSVDYLARRAGIAEGDRSSAEARSAYGVLASLVGVAGNVGLASLKMATGFAAGSIAIVADGLNNLSDVASSMVNLLGFRLASTAPNAEHPYGHGRYEYLASLFVSILIVLIGLGAIREAIARIITPEEVLLSPIVIALLLASLAIKAWMAALDYDIAARISSPAIFATAVEARNDTITTTGVLVTAAISRITGFELDGWAALAIGLLVVWSGAELVRETVGVLLGRAPSAELVERIERRFMSYEGVLGTHDLMVHDYGPGAIFASAHIEVDAKQDILVSHDILDNIEQDFREQENIMMVLHLDPIVTDDPTTCGLRTHLAAAASAIDERLTIHDLRLVPGPTHTNVLFDVVVPARFGMGDDELRERLAACVAERIEHAICKITVDQDYLGR